MLPQVVGYRIELGVKRSDWEIAKILKMSDFSLDKIESEPASHSLEDKPGRECLQVSEKGIHKAAKRIKLPTKTAPF